METIKAGLYLRDHEYRDALIRSLSHVVSRAVFETVDQRGVRPGIDVILSDSRGSLEGLKGASGVPVIVLSKDRNAAFNSVYPEVYRYSDAVEIAGAVLQVASGTTDLNGRARERKVRLVTFSSVSGGSGVTAAALSAARTLGEEGRKVLFMSTSPVDGSGRYLTGELRKTLPLIYHIKKKQPVDIMCYIHRESSFDVLGGAPVNVSVLDLARNDVLRMLDSIDAEMKYDYLFIDTGSFLAGAGRFLYESAECNVWVLGEEDSDPEESVMGSVRKLFSGGRDEPKTLVISPAGRGEGAIPDSERIEIPREPGSFIKDGGRTRIDLRGMYGKGISCLSERIDSLVFG